MAGIINKIGDALHIGGDKKTDEQNKAEEHRKAEQHNIAEGNKGEQKEGVLEKIKDKIHGDEKSGEKKKKEKKKKQDGERKHDGGDSSSDSD